MHGQQEDNDHSEQNQVDRKLKKRSQNLRNLNKEGTTSGIEQCGIYFKLREIMVKLQETWTKEKWSTKN